MKWLFIWQGDVKKEARLDEMTPRQIVAELDKHVVGQTQRETRSRDRFAQSCAPARSSRPIWPST